MQRKRPNSQRRRLLSATLAPLLMLVAACSDDSTGVEGPDVSGSWSGVASFASGFSASMSIDQTGTAVLDGCEAWAGTLDIDGTASSMEGPILIDRSGCSSGSNSSGVLRLDKG